MDCLIRKNRLCYKSFCRKGDGKIELPPSQRYILIRSVIEKYKLNHMVEYLCEIAGVSRSGYYQYFSAKSHEQRKRKNEKDEKVKEIVLKAFNFKGRKKGARQIKMTLAGQFDVVYNLKRIRRIMKKYGIICPFRRANPYRRMMKATKEHRVVPNLLNRQFKQGIPWKVLLTDITYLHFGNKIINYIIFKTVSFFSGADYFNSFFRQSRLCCSILLPCFLNQPQMDSGIF